MFIDDLNPVQKRQFYIVISIAIFFRLLAVLFSHGYSQHDDHFETVRIAKNWEQGYIWENKRLFWEGSGGNILRSPIYNAILAVLFKLLSLMGIKALNYQMYFIRFIHGFFSLLTVYIGYRIILKHINERAAFTGGLILSCYFLIPYLSVRNSIEMVSGNILLISLYFTERASETYRDENNSYLLAICAGFLFGIAVLVRWQIGISFLGIFIFYIFISKNLKNLTMFITGGLIALLIEGVIDYFISGEPFKPILNYFSGCAANIPIVGQWWNYILLLIVIFIPPFSFIFLWASLYTYKKLFIYFWPTLFFLLSHSIFPAKQERFIIPILPLIIILCTSGIFIMGERIKQKMKIHWLWGYFWAINLILLVPLTFNYSHRERIEPFVWLERQKDLRGVIIKQTDKRVFLPICYLSRKIAVYALNNGVKNIEAETNSRFITYGTTGIPNYIVVFTKDNIKDVSHRHGVNSEIVKSFEPSLLDKILNRLNPAYNKASYSYVLKIKPD